MNDDFVAWDDAYSVGFGPIDDQHKKLVTMINALFAGCKMGNVATDIVYMRTINDALEYARIHFSDEEKYMSQVDYPKLDEHKKQHEEFVAEINKSINSFGKKKEEPVEMVKFLKNWLLNHIAVSDKQYTPYLAKLAKSD